MKKVLLFFSVLFSVFATAQTDYSDRWEDLFSYTNVKDFIKSGEVFYAVTDNAVFSYNTRTKAIAKISSVQGLSGGTTSAIYYSESTKKLVIGYEDGLLEVIDERGRITTSPEITNFNQTGEKSINHIYEYNNRLYLSTSFAIVVYDLNKLEFGDTYFIGAGSTVEKVNEIAVFDNRFYAATARGVYLANVNNPNLIDATSWSLRFLGDYTGIHVFGSQLFASTGNQLMAVQGPAVTPVRTFTEPIQGLKASASSLGVALRSHAVFLNAGLGQIQRVDRVGAFNFSLHQAYEENNEIYLATTTYGILRTRVGTVGTLEEVHPEGPLFNDIFSIDAHNNNVWVVYGGYDATYTPLQNRRGYSHYNGKNWLNSPFNPSQPIGDLVAVTIDKTKENSVFLSAFGDVKGAGISTALTGGLLKIDNDAITAFYNQTNSPLQDIEPADPNRVTVRVSGTALDNRGNLWVTNLAVSNKLKKFNPSGNWQSFDLESIVTSRSKPGMNEVVVDRSNTVWIGTRRNGVYAFNEVGDKKKALTTEATKGSLPNLNVRTLGVDRNNRIWLGTLTGLVVFNNASGIFDNAVNDAQPVVIVDEGIPKKLLGDQTINSIEIDGADNKWFGTENGGVLYTNPTGQQTIASFNKDNSPLPSNKIVKIRVDDITGKVYFATNRGMVAYNSKVAPFGEQLGEVYAYPNPALKNHSTVTIDGRNGMHLPKGTNVKILDMSGNLVYETNVVEGQQLSGGRVTWNKRNLAGTKVASGVYIVLLTTEDNSESATTKIAIVN